jgi:hypothetical protein
MFLGGIVAAAVRLLRGLVVEISDFCFWLLADDRELMQEVTVSW